MNPWVDRRPEGGAPCTHALVVGVSRYEFLPQGDDDPDPDDRETFGLRQAKTPATAASNFARWLESAYSNPASPVGTVRLLLSPSEWERANVPGLEQLAAEVPPATRDNVADAVDAWYADCATRPENTAILYASGHGIQLSKDDGGIVLLEDFARRPSSVLEQSLDVGAVRKGMAGPTMAQHQFYFVDACRVRPDAAKNFQSLGSGIGLQNPWEHAPRCSAVYFSASPSTEALGEAGKGTLFSQALLSCLELLAVDDHVHENDWWVVTTASLMRALPKIVRELAASFGLEQTGTVGGQLEDVIFHVLPERPRIPVQLELEPAEAAELAVARLWDGLSTASIFDEERFAPRLERAVPAGHYVLTVTIKPPTEPFRDVPALPIPALPPAYACRVTVG